MSLILRIFYSTLLFSPFAYVNAVFVAYKVHNSSNINVNTLFICGRSQNDCLSVHGEHTLSSSYAVVNGVSQKRWFISKGGDEKQFGAIELSSDPWRLKEWKRIAGDNKELHGFEPNMRLVGISASCGDMLALQNSGGNNSRSYSDTLANHLWLLMAVGEMQDKSSAIQRELDHCSHLLSTNDIPDTCTDHPVDFLQLSRCDYLSYSGAVDSATDCYAQVFSCGYNRLFESSVNTVQWSFMVSTAHSMSPLVCSELVETDAAAAAAACHYLSGLWRMARHALVSAVDPQQAIDVINRRVLVAIGEETKNATQPQWSDPFVSLIQVAQTVLGQWPATVTADTLAVCLQVEKYAKLHGSGETVYLVFYKICRQLERHHTHSEISAGIHSATTGGTDPVVSGGQLLRDDLLANAQFLVTSLLGVGAVEVAAEHITGIVAKLNGLEAHLLPVQEKESQLLLIETLLPSSASSHTASLLLQSGNVRGAMTLYRVFRALDGQGGDALKGFLTDSRQLSLFLNTLFQVTAPVILDLSHRRTEGVVVVGGGGGPLPWYQEALLLRTVLVTVLRRLVNICSSDHSGSDGGGVQCSLHDPHLSVGGRGLFLLAYQGLNLVDVVTAGVAAAGGGGTFNLTADVRSGGMHNTSDDGMSLSYITSDATVPSLYHSLIRAVSPDLPWRYPVRTDTAAASKQQHSVSISGVRPRVAFFSFFLTRHSVGRLLAKIIAQIDTAVFDVYIITKHGATGSTTSEGDDVHRYLHSRIPPSRWVYLPLSVPQAVHAIRDLALDVLVYGDVFMDSFAAHLAMLRAAPVQVAFWGHPFTTGYSGSMDYFITSDRFEPSAAVDSRHGQFSEQLVRFDSLSFQLFPAEQQQQQQQQQQQLLQTDALSASAPLGSEIGEEHSCAVSLTGHQRRLFTSSRLRLLHWLLPLSHTVHGTKLDSEALWAHFQQTLSPVTEDNSAAGLIDKCALVSRIRLYGSLQSLMKMHPLFDQAVMRILRTDPFAVVVLSRNVKQTVWQRRFSQRLLLLEKSADGNEHCTGSVLNRVLFVNQMQHGEYSKLLCNMDVSLDPLPFGGGVTLCDAVGGGCAADTGGAVPFVTSGELQSVHRIGAGLVEVFDDSTIAVSVTGGSSSGSNDADDLILRYAMAAVDLGKAALTRKIEGASLYRGVKESLARRRIYEDDSSAREWNNFLKRLTLFS